MGYGGGGESQERIKEMLEIKAAWRNEEHLGRAHQEAEPPQAPPSGGWTSGPITALNRPSTQSEEPGSVKQRCNRRDFPRGPGVKSPPSNAGDVGSIPGPGTKIPLTEWCGQK